MLRINKENRIAIYVFYDKEGIVDDYIIYMLKGLLEVAGRIVFVVNGKITDESKEKVNSVTKEILIRENIGLDCGAVRYAFMHLGWDELSKYEEVIYLNATIYGPVYPFSEMFDKMAEKEDLDFWGISSHPKAYVDHPMLPNGYIPEHIQQYFVVYRKKFLLSEDLKYYWERLDNISTYEEAIYHHEVIFTEYFENKNYKWDVYIKDNSNEINSNYIHMFDPVRTMEEYKSPIIKRRMFFLDSKMVFSNTIGDNPIRVIEYLKKNKLYDCNLIFKNLIRTESLKSLIDNFNLKKVFPTDYVIRKSILQICKKKYKETIIICLIKNEKKLKTFLNNIDVNYIDIITVKINEYDKNKLAELFIGIKKKYKYCYVINDILLENVCFSLRRQNLQYVNIKSMFYNKNYVQNVLEFYNDNDNLGTLMPLPFSYMDRIEKGLVKWMEPKLKDLILKYKIKTTIDLGNTMSLNCGFYLMHTYDLDYFLDILDCTDNASYFSLFYIFPYYLQKNGKISCYIMNDKYVGYQLYELKNNYEYWREHAKA